MKPYELLPNLMTKKFLNVQRLESVHRRKIMIPITVMQLKRYWVLKFKEVVDCIKSSGLTATRPRMNLNHIFTLTSNMHTTKHIHATGENENINSLTRTGTLVKQITRNKMLRVQIAMLLLKLFFGEVSRQAFSYVK